LSYHQQGPTKPVPPAEAYGRVAMYAWGEDYHAVLRRKLETLVGQMRKSFPEPFETRICVDTTPVVEREMAAAAGIGWIGKNTLVLNPSLGSYFFLGVVITTLDLEPDEPMPDHCGTCTACVDACPTKAFPAPYEMDASRCISYLTIEHRGEIPASLHSAMGDWIFGCDVCQKACPHNRHTPETRESAFAPRSTNAQPRLHNLLNWSQADYARELRGSAMKRAKLAMLQRNARIALENQQETKAGPSELASAFRSAEA
ncbi:MAG TPA: tRNA epoxyqueuosine(34) reductase QueG, partial [Burkholderiales bacterium]|nr:tRNA epoxyqueuosine(34) reductase QueG [Burkholderiales bacterium]